MGAPMGRGWVAVFWLRRNSFSGFVPSNHCSQGTKSCATCVCNGPTNDAWFSQKSDKAKTRQPSQ